MTKIFLAGAEACKYVFDQSERKFNSNTLGTMFCFNDSIKLASRKCNDFILDSGAFSFIFGNASLDIETELPKYVDKYIEAIKVNNIKNFMELDIDKIVGHDEVLRITDHIENKVGRQCIPVWHFSRGKEEWLRLCRDYDYVEIGGIAVKNGRKQIEPYLPYFLRTAREYGTKVHGLGYTHIENLKKYPFYSVDSTAWVGSKYGYFYTLENKKLIKHNKRKGMKLADWKKANTLSFDSWAKYSDYLEGK